MKILFYDCSLGIKGEWSIAALLSLGVDKDYLLREISKLNLPENYDIRFDSVHIDEVLTSTFSIVYKTDLNYKSSNSYSYYDLEKIIDNSTVGSYVQAKSKAVIKSILETKAAINKTSLQQVLLEEKTFLKYLIEVVGIFICLDYIKPDKIIYSKIGVGKGISFEDEKHKLIPSALVSELLKNRSIIFFNKDFATVDEIGVAVLNEIADEFVENINFNIEKTAYGASENEKPGVFLRVYSGNTEAEDEITHDTEKEKQFIIECNIDDMNSELYDFIMKRLLEAGALDVYFTAIMMKKGRPAVKVSVLCKEKDMSIINKVLFLETTTFGTRCYEVRKNMLERSFEKIETQYGSVTIKKGYYEGKLIKAKPEYEDCKRISEELDIPISKVYYNVIKDIERIE